MYTYLSISVLGSIYILGFTYYLIHSLDLPTILIKEQFVISLVLAVSSVYTLARVFEHLFMDELLIKKKIPIIKMTFLFFMFSLCINSSVYLFIISLFLKMNFFIGTLQLVSLVALFILTIHYIETQLIHQQIQLENKNEILTINEQHYRSLFENNPDAVITLDLQGKFLAVNSSVLPLTNLKLEELLQLSVTDLVIEEEKSKLKGILEELNNGKNANFETIIKRKDDKIIKLKVTALPIKINEQITGAYIIAQDITRQIEMQEKVKFLAYHDELTGLLNRRGISQIVEKNSYSVAHSAIILIDIDLFKDINDHLGHVAGDDILRQIAVRLEKTIGRKGIIGRLGGDEFLIYLTDIQNKLEVLDILHLLQSEMKEPFKVQESFKEITLSMGVSYYPKDGQDFNTLIKHADMAMYRAKKFGRNKYIQFSPRFEEEKLKQINMLQELKLAIEQEQFQLYFQPKHSSTHNKVVGVETLVRWNHPNKGVVSPIEFIPLAEENGLIIPISNWIIREACRMFSNWMKEYHVNFHLSINISPIHFLDDEFIDFLLEQLREFQISASKIDLEITENLAIENTALTRKKIDILKEKGFQISMDDFGTGYTSLTYLSQFNLDRIKIDRSFIIGLPNNRNDGAIVQSLISVAKTLDIIVTAEGVEKEEQLQILNEWGCDEIQGYYYSRPIVEKQLIDYWQGKIQ